MRKGTGKVIAVCLTAALGLGTGGCADEGADEAGAQTQKPSVSSEKGSTEDQTASELFGKKGDEWWFDTTQFDPSKFDGKLMLDGIEVTLPMTVSSLQSVGIYCDGGLHYGDLESAKEQYETGFLNDDDEQSEQRIWREEDGGLVKIEVVKQLTMYNLDQEAERDCKPIKDSKIGTLGLSGSSTNEAKLLLESLGLEGVETDAGNYYLDVESLIEAYGPPCFYVNGSLSSYLYYYYGDYSLEFAVMDEQVCDLYYIGTEYLEADELHIVPSRSDTENAYIEAYSKLK